MSDSSTTVSPVKGNRIKCGSVVVDTRNSPHAELLPAFDRRGSIPRRILAVSNSEKPACDITKPISAPLRGRNAFTTSNAFQGWFRVRSKAMISMVVTSINRLQHHLGRWRPLKMPR